MLLVDIGNTSIKAQCWEHGTLRSSFSRRTNGNWQNCLDQYLESVESKSCYQTSVRADDIHQTIVDRLKDRFGGQYQQVSSAAITGRVINAYQQPARMGSDRWFALLGTADSIEGDAIIVDAGTAITVDLLKSDGRHLGGAIIAGFHTSAEQFKTVMRTADFEHPDILQTDKPGCTTESCIQIDYESGDTETRLGNIVRRWLPLLDGSTNLVLSGGDWRLVPEFNGIERIVFTDLVFKGLLAHIKNNL
ncbi:MAG: type III pantothenate kinase [Gammaproteobacteria bacterium]|jgi:type III pantothenate kinase